MPFSMQNSRKATQRLCNRAGIGPAANTKPGKHLPPGHPDLLRLLEYIAMQREKKSIHPLMVANFDQVWSLMYRPATSTLQKRFHTDPHSKSMSLRRLRHKIELAMDLQPTEAIDENRYRHRPDQELTGKCAASCSVDSWRVPHMITTLSWIDGRVGRGFIAARHDALSASDREQANKALRFGGYWGCGNFEHSK